MIRKIFWVLLFTSQTNADFNSLKQPIQDAARRSALDPRLVEAIIEVESNFRPLATSPKGAMGLMQVMPSTQDECEIHQPYHIVENLMGGCDCLRRLINRYRGKLPLALAAYNAGSKNVDKYKGIPPFPETRDYVRKVLQAYHSIKRHR